MWFFLGGDIVSMAEPSLVEAMWISGGRIEKLGSEDAVRAAAGSKAEVVDLEGATLMPGLIEPHTHPRRLGASRVGDRRERLHARLSR